MSLEIGIIVFLIIALIAVVIVHYQKQTNPICKSKRRLDGKTVLITGGTTGIGLQIAMDFASRGARVIIACPFEEEGKNAVEIIFQTTGDKVTFKFLDLSSFASVRDFADDFLKTEARLDILMNNAGIGMSPVQTKDGMHAVMQVNYFSHFLLTLLLHPLLRKSGTSDDPSRIVCISSGLHKIASIDVNNLNKREVVPCRVYGNSKLCLILFARELSKRLKEKTVVINSVEPGLVGTTIFNQMVWPIGIITTFILRYIAKSVYEGAQTPIHVALSKKCLVGGQYYKDCEVYPAKIGVHSDVIEKELWDETLKIVKLDKDIAEGCING